MKKIRACVDYSEYRNTYYYKEFTLVDEIPEPVSNSEKISEGDCLAVEEAYVDGSTWLHEENRKYNYYKVREVCNVNEDGSYNTEVKFICVERPEDEYLDYDAEDFDEDIEIEFNDDFTQGM